MHLDRQASPYPHPESDRKLVAYYSGCITQEIQFLISESLKPTPVNVTPELKTEATR
jgi:hypothetical protein